jgi:hypothetical protein
MHKTFRLLEIQGRFRKSLLRHMVNIIMTFMRPVEVWTVRSLHIQEYTGWDVGMALRMIYYRQAGAQEGNVWQVLLRGI